MSSDMGIALTKALAFGLALGILYLVVHLISKIFEKLGAGLNKLGEGQETVTKTSEEQDKRDSRLQTWYNEVTVGQRKFLWVLSFLLVPVYGVGLIPLTLLIYLKLGMQGRL